MFGDFEVFEPNSDVLVGVQLKGEFAVRPAMDIVGQIRADFAVDLHSDARAHSADGHLVPFARFEPLLHVDSSRLHDPTASVGLVQSTNVGLCVDFGLQA